MKYPLQKLLIAAFLFSALLWTDGLSALHEHKAYADVSRTEIETQFNRPTKRTLRKIEESRKMRLERHRQQQEGMYSSSALHTSAKVCAKGGRYSNPYVYDVTKDRLVQRIAQYLDISEETALHMLRFPTRSCIPVSSLSAEVQKAIRQNGAPSILRIDNGGSAPSTSYVPPSSPSVSTPVSTTYSAPKVTKSSAKKAGSKKKAMKVKEDGSDDKVAGSDEFDSAEFPPEAKARVLCRVQQRGETNRAYFNANVDTIAQQFADKWNMDLNVIANALLHPDLCNEDQNIYLLSSLEVEEEEEEQPVVHAAAPAEEGNGFLQAVQEKFSKVLSLPKALLVVGVLALATFLFLLWLLVAPIVQKGKK